MIDRLEIELAAFFREKYEADPANFYEWYRIAYVGHGIGLSNYDRALAAYAVAHRSDFSRFVEIGPGLGQLPILMAALGVPAAAVEDDEMNFAMINELVGRVRRKLAPDLMRNLELRHDFFPEGARAYVDRRAVLLFTNITHGLTDAQYRAVLRGMSNAGGAIVNLRMFFRARDTEAEQQQLIADICAHGFEAPEDVYVWTEWVHDFHPGRIVLFRRKRPWFRVRLPRW